MILSAMASHLNNNYYINILLTYFYPAFKKKVSRAILLLGAGILQIATQNKPCAREKNTESVEYQLWLSLSKIVDLTSGISI